jgi:hypothetical protein
LDELYPDVNYTHARDLADGIPAQNHLKESIFVSYSCNAWTQLATLHIRVHRLSVGPNYAGTPIIVARVGLLDSLLLSILSWIIPKKN